MSIRLRSLKWQAIVILVGTLLLSHVIALLVYSADRHQTLVAADTLDLTERVAGYVELAAERSGERRRSVLEAASSRFLMVEFGGTLERAGCAPFPLQQAIDETLAAALEGGTRWASCMVPLRQSGFAGRGGAGIDRQHGQVLRLGFLFPDGGVVHFEGALNDGSPFLLDSAVLYILFSVLTVGTAAYVLMGRATRPLKLFADKASEVGRDLNSPPLDEHGPEEVRAAARAFNQMQRRLQRLVSGRTEMLAAISHDMRTPLARLRLRIEFLEDCEDRTRLLRTLDEMEAMVLSVLEFLRGSAPTEQPREVDIAALVDSICLDMAATGMPVTLQGHVPSLRLLCRPSVLRRAIENLVDNAVRHGGGAMVSLAHDRNEISIRVRDKGPGIPEDQIGRVVQPFIRGDRSRNRDTGGHGLGLSTALTIAHAHGGNLLLENDPAGGLVASLVLPR